VLTPRRIVIVALCVLIVSGIAGVTLGGTSAQAGWWLVVVCGILLVAVATTKVV
jgi:hypothetical protein